MDTGSKVDLILDDLKVEIQKIINSAGIRAQKRLGNNSSTAIVMGVNGSDSKYKWIKASVERRERAAGRKASCSKHKCGIITKLLGNQPILHHTKYSLD
jgi:hypothetical protein